MKTFLNRVWKFLVNVNAVIDEKTSELTADYAYRSWILFWIMLVSIIAIISSIGSITFSLISLIGMFDFAKDRWWFAIFVPFAPLVIWNCVHYLEHSSWHLYRNLCKGQSM